MYGVHDSGRSHVTCDSGFEEAREGEINAVWKQKLDEKEGKKSRGHPKLSKVLSFAKAIATASLPLIRGEVVPLRAVEWKQLTGHPNQTKKKK